MGLKSTLAVTLAALSLHACSDDKAGLSGEYKLIGNINGPLPILLARDSTCETKLEGGSLTFSEDTLYDSRYRIVQHCPSKPDSVMPDPGAHRASYQMNADTVLFLNELGGNAGLALRRADTLKITGEQHTLVYVKNK